MKFFKLPFITTTVIIAVTLSISTAAGFLKHTILTPEDYCYTTIGSRLTCTSPTVQLSGLTCSAAIPYVGKPVYSISIAGRIPLSEVSCTGTGIFCCAEIQRVTPPICPTHPIFTIDGVTAYYKISAVHCKDQ